MKIILSLILCFFSLFATAGELYGIHFDDKVAVDGKALVLNGMGLRSVRRFGLKIKVYVMGLYLPEKICTAKDILKSEGPKRFRMVFYRNVDSEDIEEGWKDAFLKNCGSTCDQDRKKLNKFNDLMSDMRTHQEILVTVEKDKVHVDVKGRKPAQGTLEGQSFADTIQKIWLGNPPNVELKQGLLGECPKIPKAPK